MFPADNEFPETYKELDQILEGMKTEQFNDKVWYMVGVSHMASSSGVGCKQLTLWSTMFDSFHAQAKRLAAHNTEKAKQSV